MHWLLLGGPRGEEEEEKEGECLAYCVRTMNANEESEQRMRQTLPRSCPIVGWGRAGEQSREGMVVQGKRTLSWSQALLLLVVAINGIMLLSNHAAT